MAQLFPLRSDVKSEQIEAAMRWYHERGMLHRYQVDGRPYYQIGNWHQYQGTTEREAKSPYPAPDVELEVDKDIDKDIERKKDIDASRKTKSRASQELVKSDLEMPMFPAPIATPELTGAWDKWAAYRADIGSPLSFTDARYHMTTLTRWAQDDERRAIEAINYSIDTDSTELIEPVGMRF